MRNARYNNLLSEIIIIEEEILDNESEFEYDIRTIWKKTKKMDEILPTFG